MPRERTGERAPSSTFPARRRPAERDARRRLAERDARRRAGRCSIAQRGGRPVDGGRGPAITAQTRRSDILPEAIVVPVFWSPEQIGALAAAKKPDLLDALSRSLDDVAQTKK
jgi:hypothetical protein